MLCMSTPSIMSRDKYIIDLCVEIHINIGKIFTRHFNTPVVSVIWVVLPGKVDAFSLSVELMIWEECILL